MDHAFLTGRVAAMVALPLGGAIYVGAGGMEPAGQHYEVSQAQALSRIANAYVPTHVLGTLVKGSRVTLSGKDTAITALIAQDGSELMRFITKVEADGTGSLVSTTIGPPTGPHAERAAAAMQSQAYTMGLMELLAQEHVDAAIEQRPFNMLAMNPAGDAMLRDMPGMKEHIDDANASAALMAKLEQDEFHHGEGDGTFDESSYGADDWGQ